MAKKRIPPDSTLPLKLTATERDLIINDSFAPEELTRRLQIVPPPGKPAAYRYALAELDELGGYIASEANHAKPRKLAKPWEAIFDKIDSILDSYTDDEA